jgi:sulfatase modifying factor 1
MRAFASGVLFFLLAAAAHAAASADYLAVPAGAFVSALSLDGSRIPVQLAGFAMRSTPVTVGDYLAFVRAHPEWRRDRVPAVYAGSAYLASWTGPLAPGPAIDPQRPATELSWFAARAYCAGENAQLPTWYQWEYAAAANPVRADARDDAAWDTQIQQTLLARTGQVPAAVGGDVADLHGLHDMNTLVWEWVDDYAAMFVNADARNPDQTSLLKLCGGAALAFGNRDAFALIMRVAALSAMAPVDSSGSIGFRCVRNINSGDTP